jgi:hypothetical protein
MALTSSHASWSLDFIIDHGDDVFASSVAAVGSWTFRHTHCGRGEVEVGSQQPERLTVAGQAADMNCCPVRACP